MVYMHRKINPSDKYTQSINQSIHARNIPSHPLETRYGINSVSTRYTKGHILDDNKSNVPTVDLEHEDYKVSTMFYGGDRKAPWTTYAKNVDRESSLRNQFFALQRGNAHLYVPSSNSDLYVSPYSVNKNADAHALLFNEPVFNEFNPNRENYGKSIFHNNTRVEHNDYV